MKRLLLPHWCRPAGVALWAVALIFGVVALYDWVHMTPEWASALLGPRLAEPDFDFPTWSRLIYDRVQTQASNGEMTWYGAGDAPHTFNPFIALGLYIGGVMIFCSKEKREDEMTRHERLQSLLITLYITIALHIACYVCALSPAGAPTFLAQAIYNNFAVMMIILPAVHLIRRWQLKRNLKEEIIL